MEKYEILKIENKVQKRKLMEEVEILNERKTNSNRLINIKSF